MAQEYLKNWIQRALLLQGFFYNSKECTSQVLFFKN